MGAHLADVPTCQVDAPIAAIRPTLESDGPVVVVSGDDLVLGRVTPDRAADADDDVTVGEVMLEGPTTVRPATEVADMLHRMTHAGVSEVLVTRSDGRLLGRFESVTTAP